MNFIGGLLWLIGVSLMFVSGYMIWLHYDGITISPLLFNSLQTILVYLQMMLIGAGFLAIGSLLWMLHRTNVFLKQITLRGTGVPAQIEIVSSHLNNISEISNQTLGQLRAINFTEQQILELNQKVVEKI